MMTMGFKGTPGIEDPRMWSSDYDETQFRTISEASPNGLGVNEAYEMGISELFGIEPLKRYLDFGGHMNRTPAQIIVDSIPDMEPNEQTDAEKLLIGYKITALLDQVGAILPDGTRWPRPTAGFIDHMRELEVAQEAGAAIQTSIISAGHAEFMLATYDLWDLPYPDILITDDVLQQEGTSLAPEQRAKPAPFPMEVVKRKWLGESLEEIDDTVVCRRIIYTGDDATRDGGLAKNSRVRFVQIVPTAEHPGAWPEVGRFLRLGSAAFQGAKS